MDSNNFIIRHISSIADTNSPIVYMDTNLNIAQNHILQNTTKLKTFNATLNSVAAGTSKKIYFANLPFNQYVSSNNGSFTIKNRDNYLVLIHLTSKPNNLQIVAIDQNGKGLYKMWMPDIVGYIVDKSVDSFSVSVINNGSVATIANNNVTISLYQISL